MPNVPPYRRRFYYNGRYFFTFDQFLCPWDSFGQALTQFDEINFTAGFLNFRATSTSGPAKMCEAPGAASTCEMGMCVPGIFFSAFQ